ncbi:2614_t:CDS:1 [Acaulospora colombiana]|uniref:2614_t:CDS:1 n=1 Tax=Acaulospora colombiana TaxID=27376 RepID=A0ACA9MGZ5_9GLOM|nr:2614_t:CDS:1 [Acaulospora colombiana]
MYFSSLNHVHSEVPPTGSFKNKPQIDVYIKSHKNIKFSFAEDEITFQQGNLGKSDTFLTGAVHLNYPRACVVKNVHLHLKGIEKTFWYKTQARLKVLYTGEHTLVDQLNKIWEASENAEEITALDIPFKIQIPYNLQETIITEIGTVQYTLRVTVSTKGLFGTGTHFAKLYCPLKRTLTLDHALLLPCRMHGKSPNGIEYTFMLPPNKIFGLGDYVSIPMTLRFLRPSIGIEKLEVVLKALMEFSCSTQNEKTRVEKQLVDIIIPDTELQYVQSNYLEECSHIIEIFIPHITQPTCQGRFINISHQLCIKFCLWRSNTDFLIEEFVRVANISEKHKAQRSSLRDSNGLLIMSRESFDDSSSEYRYLDSEYIGVRQLPANGGCASNQFKSSSSLALTSKVSASSLYKDLSLSSSTVSLNTPYPSILSSTPYFQRW